MGRLWVNVIAQSRDQKEEWTIWNGFVDAPRVKMIVQAVKGGGE